VNPAVAVSTLIGRLISAATSITINISVATSNLYQAIRNTATNISVAISTAIATGIHTFSVATSVTVNIMITTIRGFYTEKPILAPGGIPLIAIIVFGLMVYITLTLIKRR
jgi:post-segregation antitoxin (ccd killing protein)